MRSARAGVEHTSAMHEGGTLMKCVASGPAAPMREIDFAPAERSDKKGGRCAVGGREPSRMRIT